MAVLVTAGPRVDTTLARSRREGLEAVVRRELPATHRAPDLSALDEETLIEQARTLHALRTECGCRVGEIGVLVMMLAAVADVALVRHPHTSVGAVVGLVEVAVAVVLGGVVGKISGIVAARTRYVLRVRRLESVAA